MNVSAGKRVGILSVGNGGSFGGRFDSYWVCYGGMTSIESVIASSPVTLLGLGSAVSVARYEATAFTTAEVGSVQMYYRQLSEVPSSQPSSAPVCQPSPLVKKCLRRVFRSAGCRCQTRGVVDMLATCY